MTLSNSRHIVLRLCLTLLIGNFSVGALNAQELVKSTVNATLPTTEPTVDERVRVLESELEKQNTKLDQMQKTIANQQIAIQDLLDRLSNARTTGGDPKAVVAEASTTPVAVASTETKAQPTTQALTIEQRL